MTIPEEFSKKCIAIIDHVGKKAGMDCYSGSLAYGLTGLGCHVMVFSNFSGGSSAGVVYEVVFDDHTTKNVVLKLFSFLKAMLVSSYKSKRCHVNFVILHLFATNWLSLLQIIIPKCFGLRVAVIAHDIASFRRDDCKWIQNLIYKKLSDFLVVHNFYSLDALKSTVPGLDHRKIHVIKHGGYLDYVPKNVEKSSACRSLGLDEACKYLLFFGQIKKVKGLDVLLEAMSQVKTDAKLIIAGKPWGDDFEKYDALIASNGLENRVIKMIRYIDDQERDKLFMVAGVNILPYREIYQSGVLLMAMSFGVPVIASDLPANKEVVRHGENGLLFESENPVELAKNIDLFFADEHRAVEMAHNAKLTIEREFNWSDIARRYVELA